MITVIVVTFEQSVSASKPVNYLAEKLERGILNDRLRLLIYDNSHEKQEMPPRYRSLVTYVHDASNAGVAGAYNYGLSLSSPDDWLLLLDQDTELPKTFLDDLLPLIFRAGDDSGIVAIAPHAVSGTKIVSPCRVGLGGTLRPVSLTFQGVGRKEIRAINSGMAVRASFMSGIGGFDKTFWLDFLDHWLCRTIYESGKRIYVSDTVIHHDLSVCDYSKLSRNRAENILRAESLFYRKCQPKYMQMLHAVHLVCRAAKQFVVVKDKAICRATLLSAWRMIAQR